jgi:hypothetical protein
VGAVTCLYTGAPLKGLASQLSSMFINDWFLPSILVARNLQRLRYCFGATMAVRRETLEASGGFHTLANHLAMITCWGSGSASKVSKFVCRPTSWKMSFGSQA